MYGFILFLSQHSPSFSRHTFLSFPFFFPRFCQVSQTVRRLCAANCQQGNDLGSFLPYYYAVPWYWESIWSVEVWMGDSKEKKIADLWMLWRNKGGSGGVDNEWGRRGKSTTSAILEAELLRADKDTQIVARGCLSEARCARALAM